MSRLRLAVWSFGPRELTGSLFAESERFVGAVFGRGRAVADGVETPVLCAVRPWPFVGVRVDDAEAALRAAATRVALALDLVLGVRDPAALVLVLEVFEVKLFILHLKVPGSTVAGTCAITMALRSVSDRCIRWDLLKCG